MDIVHNHVVGEACAEPCIDLWFSCPKEVSVLNQIQISEFACAVRTLPEMVRVNIGTFFLLDQQIQQKLLYLSFCKTF